MSRTCLVVDDSRVVRKVARRILEATASIVTEAGDGQQALDACRASLPDCVLLDWNMPVMDGLTSSRRCAANSAPTIRRWCSAPPKTTWPTSSEAIANGAQEYIMKPFDEDILIGKFAQVGLAVIASLPAPSARTGGRNAVARVMVCDDSLAIRGAIARMLEADPGDRVVAKVANGQAGDRASCAARRSMCSCWTSRCR